MPRCPMCTGPAELDLIHVNPTEHGEKGMSYDLYECHHCGRRWHPLVICGVSPAGDWRPAVDQPEYDANGEDLRTYMVTMTLGVGIVGDEGGPLPTDPAELRLLLAENFVDHLVTMADEMGGENWHEVAENIDGFELVNRG